MSKKRHKKQPSFAGKATPEDPRLVQGRNAFARADYQQAIHLWERLADSRAIAPESRDNLQQALAEAHFRVGQRLLFENATEAFQHLTRAAELMPDDARYAYHVGLAYHRQGNLALAIQWYKQALQRDSQEARAKQMLMLAEGPSQSLTKAEVGDALAQFESIFGNKGAQPLLNALQTVERGDWDEASTKLAGLQTETLPLLAQGLVFYYRGVAAHRQGDAERAYSFWSKALDTGLKTPALITNWLAIIQQRADAALLDNHPETALILVEQGLKASPEHKRLLEMKNDLQLHLGYAAAEAGKWSAALAAWSNAGDLGGPNARVALANSAIAYEKLEQWTKAAETWREFARRRPRQEKSEDWLPTEQVARLWERISGLYIRAENPDEAIKTLLTAIKYEPDDPKLLLALARCYADAERFEAAQNQLDKLLAKTPNDVEALVQRAELTEIEPRHSYRTREPESDLWFMPPGVAEWEAVLAQNDDTYQALAEERLVELYRAAFEEYAIFGHDLNGIKRLGERALKSLPDNSFLRALYVRALLQTRGKGSSAEAERQIEHIDLTDAEALHQLIDAYHVINEHRKAADLLQKAEALKPPDAAFYAGIGNCALHRRQQEWADRYFDESLKRSTTENERMGIPLLIGMAYLQTGQFDKGEEFLKQIHAVDPRNGPAHFLLAVLADKRGDRNSARKHLREAEKDADRVEDPSFGETVRAAKQMLNVPFTNLWNMFMNGPLDVDAPFDEMDNDDDFVPLPDRRRR